MFAVVEAANLCLATSGTYERGAHVIDPHTGRPPTGLASLTVFGPRLAIVDASRDGGVRYGRGRRRMGGASAGYGVCAVTEAIRVVYDDEFLRTAGCIERMPSRTLRKWWLSSRGPHDAVSGVNTM